MNDEHLSKKDTSNKKYKKLYHGSNKDIDILNPNISTHKQKWLYASPEYKFALAFCAKWDDSTLNHSIYNGNYYLIEKVPNAINVFDTTGYIYEITNTNSFKPVYKTTDIEVYSTERIIPNKKVKINNVLTELKKHYKIYRYPEKPEWYDKHVLSESATQTYKELYNESYETLFETAINESLLNKETIEINLDKWENSENNILYITGLSGGGKSTLAKEYSEKYNAPFFELDFITDVSYKGREWGNKILDKTYNESPELNNFIRSFINDESFIISNTKDFNRCFDVAKQFCKKAERELKGKYIFEGVQIFVKNNNDFFLDDRKSMILIGTGLITADIRAIKRTFKKNIPIKKKMKMLFYRIGDILNKKSPNNRQSLEYDEFRKIVTDYKENI